jgi:outer membrane lipoprotein-sorting protein
MKYLFSIILSVLFVGIGQAQNISSYFKDIANKDLSTITAKFSEDMEVCVNDSQEFMDKAEAIKAVKAFLDQIEPISGSELHQGSSKTKSSQYRVGQVKSAKGNYRVFIYLEGDKDDFEIVGLLFNPE